MVVVAQAKRPTSRISQGDAVIELLRREARLFGELETLAQKQRAFITSDESSPLIALLGRRRELSVELEQIGRRLTPLRKKWKSFCGQLNSSQCRTAEKLNREFSSRLSRVIANDERDAQLLQARKTLVADELRLTQSTGQALSAYQASGVGEVRPARLDESS